MRKPQKQLNKEYSNNKLFWVRLYGFVKNVQVNDPCSEEEKEMILNMSKFKINDLK